MDDGAVTPPALDRIGTAAAVAAAVAFIVRALTVSAPHDFTVDPNAPANDLPPLSIVVPARNEARQIARCVRSLLAQRYGDFEVIVVDDRSTDETAAILHRIAQSDARLRVVAGEALPPGWAGKPWAIHQGVQHARGSWLLFTDADTVHAADAARAAVAHARARGRQFLSLLTTQEIVSPAERALLPTLLFAIVFALGSLPAINDPRRLDAAVLNGQYLLAERRAYEALGGHAAVRGAIAEDYELARTIKRDGRFRAELADGSGLVRTRMYRSLGEIWNGFAKNFYLGMRDRPAGSALGLLFLLAVSPLPEVLAARAALRKDARTAALNAACAALTMLAAERAMRRSRFPAGSGAFLPLGICAVVGIAVDSFVRHRRGRVAWRGRVYGGGKP